MNTETSSNQKEKIERRSYSLDELKAFRNTSAWAQLNFLAQTYLGKPITGNDIQILYYIYNDLHFNEDLLDCLLQYCAGRGKKSFSYIEQVALTWQRIGIRTPQQAAAYVGERDEICRIVMTAFGRRGEPAPKESDYIHRWFRELHFSPEIIEEACKRAVLSVDTHRFEYADAILTSWHDKGLTTLQEVRSQDQAYRSSKAARKPSSGSTGASKPASATAFGNFKSNDYDFDAIEKALLGN